MFKIYDNGLIGYTNSNKTLQYMGSDTEEAYFKKLRTQPKDWYYRDCNITYVYNSTGHRCHEIDQTDFDNYVLFVGDSHVEGIGLEYEKTFPYLFSQKLGISYYNLGLGGTGSDVTLNNILTWLSRYKKPKYVFAYWSDPTRFVLQSKFIGFDKKNCLHAVLAGSERFRFKTFLVEGDANGYFNSKTYLSKNLIQNVCDNFSIPIFNFTLLDPGIKDLGTIICEIVDKARDDHAGIETNKIIADLLCEEFNNKYNNAAIHTITRRESL